MNSLLLAKMDLSGDLNHIFDHWVKLISYPRSYLPSGTGRQLIFPSLSTYCVREIILMTTTILKPYCLTWSDTQSIACFGEWSMSQVAEVGPGTG